ncbi:MAG: A/G-specific adenine glycosylase [Prevotella sp.]|nr:A/G-specific adenine glycosylase [Prevotella sp.]
MTVDNSFFAAKLLGWFRENGRELPWRGTKDPYAIWLSEIILQQTQVRQGWDYWLRFMRRWPTVEALAAATEDEVLRMWQGLGYYSRARNLHFAARQIVEMGGFPTTYEEIKKLKGVGDYTAAAIGSIAFGLPVAVVDGNVYRLLSRHFGIATPINTTQGKREFTALAQALLPGSEASAYNQALMDFGATVCTPQSPRCPECPLQASCVAFAEGRVGQLPVKERKLQVKERRMAYVYIRYEGQTALRRRGAGDIWQGLWEPFLLIDNGQLTIDNDANYQLSIINCQLLKQHVRHVLTHRVILCDFYLWEPRERPHLPDAYVWVDETDVDQYALPRLVELLLEALPQR